VKSRRDPMTAANLGLYRKLLEESFVMKDLKKYRNMPDLLHTQASTFFMTYPQLISKAAQNYVRVDGTPKNEREKQTFRAFVDARSRLGIVKDAVKFALAWR
jgi:electron transfer flavoprotein-quinone oxidoreductase